MPPGLGRRKQVNGKLDVIRKWQILPAALASYALLFLTPEWINLPGWEWISLAQCWLRYSILAFLATVASINLFSRIRTTSIVKAIAGSTLMIYLLEPQIRYSVGQIFAVDFFRTPLQDMQVPMLLRIVTTLFLGFAVQKLFDCRKKLVSMTIAVKERLKKYGKSWSFL